MSITADKIIQIEFLHLLSGVELHISSDEPALKVDELILSAMEHLPHYTKFQLALRNGTDKEEVWVAYKGIIYDVTNSTLWRHGKHYEHYAGQDLTDELPDAPHTEIVFERLKAVGKLSE